MKNQSRIEEILAESLKRLDQHSELLTNQTKILTNQGVLLEKLVEGQLKNTAAIREVQAEVGGLKNEVGGLRGEIVQLNSKLDRFVDFFTSNTLTQLQDQEKRIRRLEDKLLDS